MPPDRAAVTWPLDTAEARADARSMGVELGPDQAQRLLDLVNLLQRWNATYNLTAVRDPGAMWLQHVLDCLAAVPALRRHLATLGRGRVRVLDVGSGGALPGAVWAIAMPELDITCLDTVGKKVAFIRQVAGQLLLANLQGVQTRVEEWQGGGFDLVASRAFASLADFTRWTSHLLAPGGCWVAMKGKTPDDELRALGTGVQVFHVEPLSVPGLGAERCLVWMRPAAATAG